MQLFLLCLKIQIWHSSFPLPFDCFTILFQFFILHIRHSIKSFQLNKHIYLCGKAMKTPSPVVCRCSINQISVHIEVWMIVKPIDGSQKCNIFVWWLNVTGNFCETQQRSEQRAINTTGLLVSVRCLFKRSAGTWLQFVICWSYLKPNPTGFSIYSAAFLP